MPADDFTLVPTWVEPETRQYHNIETRSESMKREVINLSATPLRRFRLRWEGMSDADYATLLAHYSARYGEVDPFTWTTPPTYISTLDMVGRWVDGSLDARPLSHAWWVEVLFELDSYAEPSDVFGGGTCYASSYTDNSHNCEAARDEDTDTFWSSKDRDAPHWWAVDFGVGVSHAVNQIKIYPVEGNGIRVKDYTIYGSNAATFTQDGNDYLINMGDWTALETGQCPNVIQWTTDGFSNAVAYRYIMLYVTTIWPEPVCGKSAGIYEIEGYAL